MAGEVTVPLLPCGSIDEVVTFYEVLGFERTYYQTRPNPYVSLRREDLRLDFFGMPGFEPENSYGSCVVLVPDTGELFQAFADGMRAAYGKILVAGMPRMTRPRKRKNVQNLSGFSVIDPGGNWIRIFAAQPAAGAEPEPQSRLGQSLRSAVVMGDSHGSEEQAIRILDSGLGRYREKATAAEVVSVLAYRAELAVRIGDAAGARGYLQEARKVPLGDGQRHELAEVLDGMDELEGSLDKG